MFIEEVMELVELNPLRNALVGLPGVNGLSTEQRKRLTIAVELVANPSIIFMDEPTSGLDARAAAIVMRTVRNTVNTGRTVVCTIHQPSIDIFEAFDEVRNINCYIGFVFLIDIAGDAYILFLNAVVPDEERRRGDLRRPIGSPVQRPNQLL
jgi:ABC-type Mn2+/Zn2+ transport system ATPase subunit